MGGPCAAYYAHLAAARGKCMLSKFEASSDTESLASGPRIGTHVRPATLTRAASWCWFDAVDSSRAVQAEFAPISPKLATKMFYI